MPSNEGQAPGLAQQGRAAGGDRRSAFGETANPAQYVPREATEHALLALERAVRCGRCAALTAPPGLGKSLLLRLLEKRLARDFQCVFLPYGALSTSDLCNWTLGLLGETAGDDPLASLLRYARFAA